jgi:dimethylhistidine N-methyltransferase
MVLDCVAAFQLLQGVYVLAMPGLRRAEGDTLRTSVESDLVYVAQQASASDLQNFERDVHRGLSRTPKVLSSMYFYDDQGSELFRRIMELPEYYLTRAELEVLERHGRSIVAPMLDEACDVVDLGAGDGLKTQLLLEQLRQGNGDVRYVPIDVSDYALRTALDSCRQRLPWISARGVVAEYAEGIAWLGRHEPGRRRFVLALGSNIGNLQRAEATEFFRSLRAALSPGDHVLVGFDLMKDVQLLQRAYDDSAGVTAEFNLGLLRRINRELGADFDVTAFRHFATFSPQRQAMESYLMSVRGQRARVGAVSYAFDAWEGIQTEVSCKYRPSDVRTFASQAGFTELQHFYDERHWFLDALWRVGDDADAPMRGRVLS